MRIKIGEKYVGPDDPTYVIAEAGVNHNNEPELAKRHIVEAAKAGADAIKFQTYKAEKLVTKTAPRFWEWEGDIKPKEGTQYDSYSAMDKFPLESYPELVKTCKENGIEFMSTPFDEDSVDFLVDLGIRCIKISSSDITYLPFLSHVAKKQLPIFLSTGASTIGEIEEAVKTIEAEGNKNIILNQCTLAYPTEYKDANLRVIPTLAILFPKYVIGISDHTLGIAIPPAAVALGARAVEKHYTVDKNLPLSPDHHLSVDPKELKEMITQIRNVEEGLGESRKFVLPAEEITYKYDKRSLVSTQDIPKGTTITKEMLTGKRPGTGIRPKFLPIVVGRKAHQDIKEDTTLTWDMV